MEMSMPVAGAQSPPKPTWVLPHPFEPYVYVANNGTDEIVEIDLNDWTISRRWEADGAPYNLDVTSDGRLLVASLKKAGMTGVYNLQDGREIARIKNTRRVTHGVVISPDNRYAFISVEGIGGEPGAVDVIDLSSLAVVASADVGMQAGGIAFWKMDR
jgi:DNA-binding beta-propeller fold protein YncE